MNPHFIECLTNPHKHKLLMTIHELQEATTKDLAQVTPHLPQTTLYRTLKKMLTDGLIKVIKENRVRNVHEKVYALAIDLQAELAKIADDKSGATFLTQFRAFTNGLTDEFEKNFPRNTATPESFGFGMLPIHATNAEVIELRDKIQDLLQPYHNAPLTDGRTLRNFALIFTPPPLED